MSRSIFGNSDAGYSRSEMQMKCAICEEIWEDHNDEKLGHEFVEPEEDFD